MTEPSTRRIIEIGSEKENREIKITERRETAGRNEMWDEEGKGRGA